MLPTTSPALLRREHDAPEWRAATEALMQVAAPATLARIEEISDREVKRIGQ
jgi:hypothetical protein